MPKSNVLEKTPSKTPAEGRGKICPRHGCKGCACGMGNLFRFVEPLILLELRNTPGASGYDILASLDGHTLTGTTIDKAAVYRALAVLETNGMTLAEWTESVRGAGRKSYRLTLKGEEHLAEWAELLEGLAVGLREFVKDVRSKTASTRKTK